MYDKTVIFQRTRKSLPRYISITKRLFTKHILTSKIDGNFLVYQIKYLVVDTRSHQIKAGR